MERSEYQQFLSEMVNSVQIDEGIFTPFVKLYDLFMRRGGKKIQKVGKKEVAAVNWGTDYPMFMYDVEGIRTIIKVDRDITSIKRGQELVETTWLEVELNVEHDEIKYIQGSERDILVTFFEVLDKMISKSNITAFDALILRGNSPVWTNEIYKTLKKGTYKRLIDRLVPKAEVEITRTGILIEPPYEEVMIEPASGEVAVEPELGTETNSRSSDLKRRARDLRVQIAQDLDDEMAGLEDEMNGLEGSLNALRA